MIKIILIASALLTLPSCQKSGDDSKIADSVRITSTQGEDLFEVTGSPNLNYSTIYGLWEGSFAENANVKITARMLFQSSRIIFSTKCQIKKNGQLVDTLYTAVESEAEISSSTVRFLTPKESSAKSTEGTCDIKVTSQETMYNIGTMSKELCFGGSYPKCLIMNKIRD